MNELIVLYIAIVLLIILTVISLILHKFHRGFKKYKLILFIAISLLIIFTTGIFIGDTIFINSNSITKGPVHWHADFEVFNCGERLELIDPRSFIINKVGSPLFHEHNDNRIHIEGTVVNEKEITLSSFFSIIGGNFTKDELIFPTNNRIITMKSGDICNNQKGELQVFIYKTKDNTVILEKENNPNDYIISPHPNIPPGDCIIIESDIPKITTNRICKTLEIAIKNNKVNYGS